MDTDSLQRAALAKQLRMDPPPYDITTGIAATRVRVKVACTPTQQVCCGQVFTAGEAVYEVYSTDVADIEAQVDSATEADMALVDRDLANHQAMREAGTTMRDRPYSPSWSASFRRVMNRDPLPFRNCELIEQKPTRKRAAG